MSLREDFIDHLAEVQLVMERKLTDSQIHLRIEHIEAYVKAASLMEAFVVTFDELDERKAEVLDREETLEENWVMEMEGKNVTT